MAAAFPLLGPLYVRSGPHMRCSLTQKGRIGIVGKVTGTPCGGSGKQLSRTPT